jgi:hypothetical protein
VKNIITNTLNFSIFKMESFEKNENEGIFKEDENLNG